LFQVSTWDLQITFFNLELCIHIKIQVSDTEPWASCFF